MSITGRRPSPLPPATGNSRPAGPTPSGGRSRPSQPLAPPGVDRFPVLGRRLPYPVEQFGDAPRPGGWSPSTRLPPVLLRALVAAAERTDLLSPLAALRTATDVALTPWRRDPAA
ncbi:hypothetical protein [Streptomyces sp. NRRL WC-3742]|uniref:hypothetical protein n=1 Tax=Streptomyces sp. NRRL WC-3742 TaxID=1463934 RepID=UPI0018FED36A|nr:hypothetical protein [Streptomyces sp. NRRL WC-3742]